MEGQVVHAVTIRLSGTPEAAAEALIDLTGFVAGKPEFSGLQTVRLETGDLLDEPLSAIGIKPRLCSSLWHYRGIKTVGHLLQYTEAMLYHPHKVGKPSILHIKQCLANFGLKLRDPNPVSR